MTDEAWANLLLVEDSKADVNLFQMLFDCQKVRLNIHVARDGQEALDFLNHEGEFADAPRPDMVLFDINMPVMNGHEAMRRMRADERLADIPTAILSTSDSDEDMREAKKNGAFHYFVKMVKVDEFVAVVARQGVACLKTQGEERILKKPSAQTAVQ